MRGERGVTLEVADELGVTVDNLYNIKKRALTNLIQIARKEY